MFDDCKTQEEIHKRYREIRLAFHPDHGGSDQLIKLLQKDRQMALERKVGYARDEGEFGYDKRWYEDQIEQLVIELNNSQNQIAELVEHGARFDATRQLFLERQLDNAIQVIQVIDRQEREIQELETQVKHMEYLLYTTDAPKTFWGRVKYLFFGCSHTRTYDA